MIKVLFICHGNICRSPMAEFVFKKICSDDPVLRDHVVIDSAAVSSEETGNDIYPYAKSKLREKGIPFEKRKAKRIVPADHEIYDLLIGMDDSNIRSMCRVFGEKQRTDDIMKRLQDGCRIFCLSEFYGSRKGIADPWYTGDFELAYSDIERGCKALAEVVKTMKKQDTRK